MATVELQGDKTIIIKFNHSHACLWWLDKIRSDMEQHETLTQESQP